MTNIEPEHPEIPFPLPPERTPPRRTDPIMVPVVPVAPTDAWEQLAEQRRVLVSGRLDHPAVTELSARLMALDGSSGDDVEIVINSTGGPLADVFPLLDVLDLMRCPTHVTVIGSALGTAVAAVACASGRRRAAPNATFRLRIDAEQTIEGSASQIGRETAQLDAMRRRYIATLAAATRLDADRLSAEIDRGGYLTARQATELGLIDTVADRGTVP